MGEFQPGDFINHRYQVSRRLGRGAMGTVYLAEDVVKVHRLVALKVLRSDNLDDPDMWSKGEYEALIRLRHPNLARVFDFGRIQGKKDFFIVSEFIRGKDLLSATHEIPFDELLDIIAQICRALEYIHSQGYVHFDIKPDNILVTREKSAGDDQGSKVEWNPRDQPGSSGGKGPPRVKLIDFGLAEQITGTFDFAIKGTFNYVAPEIISGQTPDKRADLYSFGVTLYQILTASLPFVSEDGKTIARDGNAWRERVRRTLDSRPRYITEILLRLLEEDPELRYASAREIIQSLNSGAGRRYQIETAETQASYLYCSRLIGRRKELNRLKNEAEAIFGPSYQAKRAATGPAVPAPLALPTPVDGDSAAVVPVSTPPSAAAPSVESNVPSTPLASIGGAAVAADSGDLEEEHATPTGREEVLHRVPMVLVSGEIGVGKSRLLEEFTHFMRMREIPIYVGNCYETSKDAYQPFREVITEAGLSLGRESPIFQRFAGSIRRLCPKLQAGEPPASEDASLRPDKDRLYFIDRLANFIIEAALTQPFVMILNNLHWADEGTVELLGHLTDEIAKRQKVAGSNLGLMVISTLRLDENLSEALRTLLARFKEEELARELVVRRFTRTQIAELMHHMLQIEEISTSFLNRLEERTSGNPLFIVETLKGLQEEGIIARDGDAWKIRGGGDLSRVDIPHGVEGILLRRVQMLQPQQKRILEALSVYDKPMSSRLLERFPEFSAIKVVQELRELENRGMVQKTLDTGRLLFSISQPKLREIVYGQINEERSRLLHGCVADALAVEYSGRIDEILEDLAYHYQRSDRVGKALELTVQAGDRSRRIFAHDRALEHYRHVLRQTEGDQRFRRIWIETHEKIADIAVISGSYDTAQTNYDCLLQIEVGVEFSVADRSRILRKRAKLDEIQGEYDRALRGFKAAQELADAAPEGEAITAERIRVYNSIGWIHVCMGKYEKAMKVSGDALRMVGKGAEHGEHAMIFTTIGCANYFKGNIEQAIEYHARALSIRENLEDVPEIIISLNNLGDAHLANAEYSEAIHHFETALKHSAEVGDSFGRAMALHNLSATFLALGLLDRSEKLLQESLDLSRQFRMRFLSNQNYLLRGRLRREQDELAKAEGDLFRVMGVFAKQGNRWALARCLFEVAELQQMKGNHAEALKMIHEGIANARALHINHLDARGQLLEARSLRLCKGKELPELLAQLDALLNSLESCKNPEFLGEIHQERGEILVQLRRVDEARAAFQRSDDGFREVADRLPSEFVQVYLTRFSVGGKEGEAGIKEVPDVPAADTPKKEKTVITSAPAMEPMGKTSASSLTKGQGELLRLASLLQEMGQQVSPRVFIEKVLICMTQALGADEAFLLTRNKDDVRIIGAVNKKGEKVRTPSERLCLEALEHVIDTGNAILAPRVLNHPTVRSFESLYKSNVASLVVVPLKIDGSCRGAVYMNNPDPSQVDPAGLGMILASYTNLLSLILPRVGAQTVSTS